MLSEHHKNGPLHIGSLIFGSLLKLGGYQVFIYNLLKHLSQKNHRVSLLVTENEYAANRTFYGQLPFTVFPLIKKTKWFARYLPWIVQRNLQTMQKKHQFDIWQIVGAYPAGFLATPLAGTVPLVLRTHGDDIQRDDTLSYGLTLDTKIQNRVRETCHTMDRLIALTPSVSTCYQTMGIPNHKIIEIPNGIDCARLQKPVEKDTVKEKWHLPTDHTILLTVGRNHPKKGYNQIPEIASLLKTKGLRFTWLLVGKDTHKLAPLLKTHQVTQEIKLIDEIGGNQSANSHEALLLPGDELIELYQSADMFVFPSHLETFGRVLIEAMAAGLPVVTTDAPGCRDVVTHNVTGLQTQPNNISEMAEHILALHNNQDLRNRLIHNALAHSQKYDWQTIVNQYETLYYSLTKAQVAPSP